MIVLVFQSTQRSAQPRAPERDCGLSTPVLAVHGGAGTLERRKTQYPGRRRYEQGIAEALQAGQQVLRHGGSAVNAVTEAVIRLEDNELFNAAKGSVLCADGSVELSASIMRGRDLAVGAMVGLKHTKNPIKAARSIMGHTHGLLFGVEGDAYAKSTGLDPVEPDYFYTRTRIKQWERYKGRTIMASDHSDDEAVHGTVGAVARDRRGNLAAATSTGGLVNQLPGRVGDTPVVGASTWADNRTCAVSATGKGDAFARIAFARRVADLIELAGLEAEVASITALEEVKRVRGVGGCIIVDATGSLSFPFNSKHLIRGWVVGQRRPRVAFLPGEEATVL